MKPPIPWTIAGYDPSSGAGITADLLTFAAHGLFGCSAITALTVQSTLGVAAIEPVAPEFLRNTLQHLERDLPPAGVKIGMLGAPKTMSAIADFLGSLNREMLVGSRETPMGRRIPIVLDPVLRSSSGRELYPLAGLGALRQNLLPAVDFITPNWGELALLAGMPVNDLAGAERAARALLSAFPQLHIVVTGGDQALPVDLLLTPAGQCFTLPGAHIESQGTHGTGCAFSSALLAHLVLGLDALAATRAAKSYVAQAIHRAPGLGGGKGPLGLLPNHSVPGSSDV